MSFVDFMIIGAMKSGTTSLSELLSMHPEVCFCKKKEPHFFSKSPNWKEHIEEYKNLYNPTGNQICGEASTTYTYYPKFNKDIWQDLYTFNPNLKLIYIMRDPVDRIVSHYMHFYLRGYTSEPFEKVVLSQAQYINTSRYFVQIKPYIDIFGQKQVLLLTFEEFIANQKIVLNKIADFLGIDNSLFCNVDDMHTNKSVGEYKNSVKTEKISKNLFIRKIKPFFPKFIKQTAFDILDKTYRRKLDAKPTVSKEIEKVIYDLLILDVLEIEKIMGRELNEWSKLKKYNCLVQN